MVGFYDDSYQELRRYKRKKNAALIFFCSHTHLFPTALVTTPRSFWCRLRK